MKKKQSSIDLTSRLREKRNKQLDMIRWLTRSLERVDGLIVGNETLEKQIEDYKELDHQKTNRIEVLQNMINVMNDTHNYEVLVAKTECKRQQYLYTTERRKNQSLMMTMSSMESQNKRLKVKNEKLRKSRVKSFETILQLNVKLRDLRLKYLDDGGDEDEISFEENDDDSDSSHTTTPTKALHPNFVQSFNNRFCGDNIICYKENDRQPISVLAFRNKRIVTLPTLAYLEEHSHFIRTKERQQEEEEEEVEEEQEREDFCRRALDFPRISDLPTHTMTDDSDEEKKKKKERPCAYRKLKASVAKLNNITSRRRRRRRRIDFTVMKIKEVLEDMKTDIICNIEDFTTLFEGWKKDIQEFAPAFHRRFGMKEEEEEEEVEGEGEYDDDDDEEEKEEEEKDDDDDEEEEEESDEKLKYREEAMKLKERWRPVGRAEWRAGRSTGRASFLGGMPSVRDKFGIS